MRKRGRTINRRARSLPGIVVQACDMRYELRLRECVEAFRHGCADGAHHADLADCRDLILIALESGHCRHDDSAHVTIDLAGVALTNILERQSDRGRWGCTGDELQALELLAEYSMDFWSRRSGALYFHAYQRLRTIRVEQARRLREAAA